MSKIRKVVTIFAIILGNLEPTFTILQDSTGLNIRGIAGQSVRLPCLAVKRIIQADPILIVWFQGNLTDPIYSLDRRSGGTGNHWTKTGSQSRIDFNLILDRERLGILTIDNLRYSDQNYYRCRVDYRDTPSVHSTVNLTVIVPPTKHLLLVAGELVNSTLVTNSLGDTLNLTCTQEGGIPSGLIFWSWNKRAISNSQDSRYLVSSRQKGNQTISTISINNITRGDNGTVISCGLQILDQVLSTVNTTLSLILPPTGVKITARPNNTVHARSYRYECAGSGSNPVLNYIWTLVDKTLESRIVLQSGVSGVLDLAMNKSFEGYTLVCGVFNPLIQDSILEDSLTLHVLYEPDVLLEYGTGIQPSNIREGEDVYINCRGDGRPPPHSVIFYRNGVEIQENKSAGKIISSSNLVLQNISKSDTGQYSCSAENIVGRSTSNMLWLTVKYAPVCVQVEPEYIGMSMGDTKTISCPVSGNPQNLTVHWFLNTTLDNKEYLNLPGAGLTGHQVQYTLRNQGDLGSLQCFGENSIGYQQAPCIFHIQPSGPPEPPLNCTTVDPDPRQIAVTCTSGYDGGIKQTFFGELYELGAKDEQTRLVRNLTTETPVFYFYNLEPGYRFKGKFYASNEKGLSPTTELRVSTVKETFRLPLLTLEDGSSELLEYNKDAKNQQQDIDKTVNKMFIYLGVIVSCTSVCACVNLLCGWKLYSWRTSQAGVTGSGLDCESGSPVNTFGLAEVQPADRPSRRLDPGPAPYSTAEGAAPHSTWEPPCGRHFDAGRITNHQTSLCTREYSRSTLRSDESDSSSKLASLSSHPDTQFGFKHPS